MKKEFYNLKYGKCKLLDYIVCTYIDNMGTMMGQEFFETLNQATLYFNKGA